jgi:hypothetical protein
MLVQQQSRSRVEASHESAPSLGEQRTLESALPLPSEECVRAGGPCAMSTQPHPWTDRDGWDGASNELCGEGNGRGNRGS